MTKNPITEKLKKAILSYHLKVEAGGKAAKKAKLPKGVFKHDEQYMIRMKTYVYNKAQEVSRCLPVKIIDGAIQEDVKPIIYTEVYSQKKMPAHLDFQKKLDKSLKDISGKHTKIEEFDGGYTLLELMQHKQNTILHFPINQRIKIALKIIEAVEALHDDSIVLTNLAPHNIFITGDGDIKFLDYSMAVHLDENNKVSNKYRLPDSNPLLKANAYMAPESRYIGKDILKATDTYSLGLVINDLLRGSATLYDTKLKESAEVSKDLKKQKIKDKKVLKNTTLSRVLGKKVEIDASFPLLIPQEEKDKLKTVLDAMTSIKMADRGNISYSGSGQTISSLLGKTLKQHQKNLNVALDKNILPLNFSG